jgi:hypothetical protein
MEDDLLELVKPGFLLDWSAGVIQCLIPTNIRKYDTL